MNKTCWLFLLIAYGLCWTIGFGYFALGGEITSPMFMLVAAACMMTPAIATFIVQKVIRKRPLTEYGLRFKFNKWIILAALLPMIPVLLTVGTNLLMPGTSMGNGEAFIISQLESVGAPASDIDEVRKELMRFGGWTSLVLIISILGSGLVAGFTINGLVGFGEELGWRGLMQAELAHLGFWRSSAIIGFFWGLWHAPLILNGHNYPDHTRLGVLIMIGSTILLSPLHAFVRIKADSVIAPAIMHGVINAIVMLPLYFVVGGHKLAVGFTGLAGFITLVITNIALWAWMKQFKPLIPSGDDLLYAKRK